MMNASKWFDYVGYTVLMLLGLSLVACATMKPQERRDDQLAENIAQKRSAAQASPGNAGAALDYGSALLEARNEGLWSRKPPLPREKFHEAQKLLERAAQTQAAEAPMLIAYKGVLHCSIGEQQQCDAALSRSMQLRPNEMALTYLVGQAANRGNYERVARVCQKTLPHLPDDQTVYDVMEYCREHSGAASLRGGIAWAPERYQRFYLQERQRRQDALQRQRQAERQRQANAEYCAADCREEGNLCIKDCYSDQCEVGCQNAYDACLDKCEVQANF